MSFRQLIVTKSLDQLLGDSEKPEFQLKRTLGPVQITLLGVGAIIGAGIFATVGTAAAGDAYRPGAGPALVLSFVVTAVVCGFTALCYAELAAMVPISGSAYTYAYATLGELVAWIIGWDLIIEYAVGNIAVAISWANYFKTLIAGFGIQVPDWASMDYRTAGRVVDASGVQTVFEGAPHLFGAPVIFNFLAVGIVALITLVLVWGIRESARFNAVMVVTKIAVLLFFVVIGLYWVKPENWVPFAPNGWAGISAGAAIVFFAYIGFDAVSTVAEETRDPQKNLPRGIIASLIICTVFYIAVSGVFTGLVSYGELKGSLASEQAEPLTWALARASGGSMGWAVGIVAFGAVVAQTAVLLVFQLGQPRILFSMSRDGLLPSFVGRVHPRWRTPHVATILTGIFVATFAAVASVDEMVDLTNIGTLFAFILVCIGVIVLRIREPNRPRPFRVPGGWKWALGLYLLFAVLVWMWPASVVGRMVALVVGAAFFAVARNQIMPVLGICSCLYLIYYLPPTSWLRFAAWLNFGFLLYATYGSIKSRLTGRETVANKAAHDLVTATHASWLYAAGTALLGLTRALDVALEASKRGADAGQAFAAIFRVDAWLAPSGFMLLPLLLNAALLAPIAIGRAFAAQAALRQRGEAAAALAPAVILAALAGLSVLYALAVLIRTLG
jgi:basic amino acid/polyamine antiporter, APA family